ncbi:MAG TPA: metallophosphoesterase, partial [Candidatus Binatia bacterium]|nr:metallophosphoesterase [Candidatus Binatia bacterium]
MKRTLVIVAAVGWVLSACSAIAGNGNPINQGSADPLTLAVYGDWPYSQALLDAAPLLIDSINSDPKVRLVMHVGDIHSGSMPCTGAGLDPLPATSKPAWNQGIFALFEQFKDPVVYTPGDNEWTDCHKTKQGTSGYPLNELAAVRALFFADPGYTLGGRKKQVLTQAQAFDPAHPTDAQFVENVLWEES